MPPANKKNKHAKIVAASPKKKTTKRSNPATRSSNRHRKHSVATKAALSVPVISSPSPSPTISDEQMFSFPPATQTENVSFSRQDLQGLIEQAVRSTVKASQSSSVSSKPTFQNVGLQMQYEVITSALLPLSQAIDRLASEPAYDAVLMDHLMESQEVLKRRQEDVSLADQYGWPVVEEMRRPKALLSSSQDRQALDRALAYTRQNVRYRPYNRPNDRSTDRFSGSVPQQPFRFAAGVTPASTDQAAIIGQFLSQLQLGQSAQNFAGQVNQSQIQRSTQPNAPAPTRRIYNCHSCGLQGHYARDCPFATTYSTQTSGQAARPTSFQQNRAITGPTFQQGLLPASLPTPKGD